ncbi:MAG: orotate phosphoribosyltransferase [Actinomycetaceae bacterium]|nr:orotate phosphoribosyltransferase [Actinomycetaceae bacterium]
MSRQVAQSLLDIEAVFLRPDQPFIWASGIKSPIYTDNRLVLTAPVQRTIIADALAATITERFPGTQVLMGTATAGIAHAALAAERLGLPMGYVRGSAKGHGRANQIEGRLEPGQRVVVVEDLISTGGSVLDVVDALRDAGAEVLGVVALFTYGMTKAHAAFEQADVALFALTNFDDVVDIAVRNGSIAADAAPRLRAFRDNPQDQSWMEG